MATAHTTLSAILTQAGFGGQALRDAEGVVWAESSANTLAINKSECAPGEHAVGLGQVCTIHCGSYGLSDNRDKCTKQLQNPVVNAKVMKAIFDDAGGTFARDWSTWQDGSAQKHRRDGHITADTGDCSIKDWFFGRCSFLENISPIPPSLPGDIAGAADDAGKAVNAVPDFLHILGQSSTWFRLGKGFLGGVFVVLGVGSLVLIVGNKVSGTPMGKAAMML